MIERIEINLLPAEYRVHHRRLRIPREIVYPLIGLLFLGGFLGYRTVALENRIGEYRRTIAELEQQIARNRHIKKEIQKLQRDRREVFDKIRGLQRISVNKEKWVRLLEIVSSTLPKWTWINSISERAKSSTVSVLDIKGNTFSFPEVASYMTQLEGTEYIESVDLSSIDESGGEDKYFQFAITATVNPDAGLDKTDLGQNEQP